MASIKVLLADDHSLFREGLRKVIENEPGLSSSRKSITEPTWCPGH